MKIKNGTKESIGKLHIEYNWEFLESQMKRVGKNKIKYGFENWKKPINVQLLKDALLRHTLEVMKGNYEDDGDALGHLSAIALNASFIHYQLKNKKNGNRKI